MFFVREGVNKDTVAVVEDNGILRWWHHYEWNVRTWIYRTSSEVMLCRVAVLGEEIGGGDRSVMD
jgi:hypothetical protein